MPARMHSFYLRNMYQENLLAKPGGIKLRGDADRPAQDQDAELFPLDARGPYRAVEIAPIAAPSCYAGPKRFVLAASGHIAGVVNPPDGGKYSHWINDDLPPDPEEWFKGATELAGSWWPDWQRWVTGAGQGRRCRRGCRATAS